MRFLVILYVCALGACTTIAGGADIALQVEQQQILPIKTEADALVERFTERGWAAKSDPAKQVNRLANLITGGWGKKKPETTVDPVEIYLANLNDHGEGNLLDKQLRDEIKLASSEIKTLSEAVKIADRFAHSDVHLRTEMLSLEQVILTAGKAKKLFVLAAKRSQFETQDVTIALAQFALNIQTLTEQTDDINKSRQVTVHG